MALNVAIDVNRYSDFCRGEASAQRVLRTAARIAVPFVVLAELRAGFLRGARAARNEAGLITFLQSPRVSVLFPDEATMHVYASLHTELRRAGTPIPTNDLWIAALVIQHDLVLFSRDQHFDLVPRLARV
ncbi:MAG: type II toxin-antitoxin system VapC family toxin [Planctomycetes bacterium]|nr:type II toxin-antitoxin system VapC family toxin [Planctomycetota bacterium]